MWRPPQVAGTELRFLEVVPEFLFSQTDLVAKGQSLPAVLKRSSVRFAHMRYRLPKEPFGNSDGIHSAFPQPTGTHSAAGASTSFLGVGRPRHAIPCSKAG